MKIQMLVEHVLRLEHLLGIPLFAVGGCVRDTVLRRTVKDYDFATPEHPDLIEKSIQKAGKKAYSIGKRFGTIAFKDDSLGMIEITCFRGESYSPGSRKPQVSFVSDLFQDLSRRDFTINAMAISSDGKMHDPHHGIKDLHGGILRCVGNPMERFMEDPLRILRGVRFAVELNMSIDDQVEDGIKKTSWNLLSISKERITTELDKIFQTSYTSGLELLSEMQILPILFTECYIAEVTRELLKSLVRMDDVKGEIKGWAQLFEYLVDCMVVMIDDGDGESPEKMIALTRKRRLLFNDLVDKYSLHYRFSKNRTALLKEYELSPIKIHDVLHEETNM